MKTIIDDETMYKGTKVKQYLEAERKEIKEKIERIISNLGENRDRNNSLISITFSRDFSTNSIEMLKERLNKEFDKIFSEEDLK